MTALGPFGQVRGIDLEIGAGQIIKQHVEIGVEQIAPAPDQMREQRFLMLQQQVVTGIKLVLFRKAEVRPQQIGHRAVAEPLAMQPPFAARRDQPVSRENLQNLVPARLLPARRQPIGPEPIELKLLPQLPGQPAGTPLPRTMKLHLRRTKLNDGCIAAATSHRSSGNSASVRERPASSSNTSIALRQAAACEELISPRYSTCRCTTRPSSRRLFSTTFQ